MLRDLGHWKIKGGAALFCLILLLLALPLVSEFDALAKDNDQGALLSRARIAYEIEPNTSASLFPFQSGDRLIFAILFSPKDDILKNNFPDRLVVSYFDADSRQVFTEPDSLLNSQINVHNPQRIEKNSCKERDYYCLLERLGFSAVRRRLLKLVTGRYVSRYAGDKSADLLADLDDQITRPRTVWFRVAVRRFFQLPVGYLADISSNGGNCSQPVNSFLAYFDKERQIKREISLLGVADTDEPFIVREECQIYGVESYGRPDTPYRAATRSLDLDKVYVLSDKRVLLTFWRSLDYLIFSGAFPSDLKLQDANVFIRDAEATADCLEALIRAKEVFLKEFRASNSGQEVGLYHQKGQEAAFKLIDSGTGNFAKTGHCPGEE